jgi:glutathione S-transferase
MGNDHPDAKLFPHATGAAEQMVKAHQKEEPLKLYSGWVYTQSPGYSK